MGFAHLDWEVHALSPAEIRSLPTRPDYCGRAPIQYSVLNGILTTRARRLRRKERSDVQVFEA